MRRKLKIIIKAKTKKTLLNEDNGITRWRQRMQEFIDWFLRSRNAFYRAHNPFNYFSSLKLVILSSKNCCFLTYQDVIKCNSPFFYIKDVIYYYV